MRASSPPSRPTPLCLTPPNGVLKSRTNQQFTHTIPELSFVTLKVSDVLGNKITTLVNETIPAGIYEVEFNQGDLMSGIYFYSLQAGSYVETKKMVMLK